MGQVWEGTSPRWAGAPPHKGPMRLGFAPFHSPLRLRPWWGGTSLPGAGPLPHLAHAALRGWWPHLVDHRDPPGGPGTLP